MSIYIITGTSGEYSDRCDWNVCCFMDEGRANQFADKMNRLTEFKNNFWQRVRNEFETPYRAAHDHERGILPPKPAASAEFRAVMAIPSKDRTDDGRVLLRKLQAEHIEKIRLWDEQIDIISERNNRLAFDMEEARNAWVKEHYIIPIDLEEVAAYCKSTTWSDARYSVDQVELR